MELIYFDEFSLAPETSRIKDGVNRNTKGFIIPNEDNMSLSMIVAFSSKWIYVLFSSCETISLEEIKYFYSEIHKVKDTMFKDEGDPILVCDNA